MDARWGGRGVGKPNPPPPPHAAPQNWCREESTSTSQCAATKELLGLTTRQAGGLGPRVAMHAAHMHPPPNRHAACMLITTHAPNNRESSASGEARQRGERRAACLWRGPPLTCRSGRPRRAAPCPPAAPGRRRRLQGRGRAREWWRWWAAPPLASARLPGRCTPPRAGRARSGPGSRATRGSSRRSSSMSSSSQQHEQQQPAA